MDRKQIISWLVANCDCWKKAPQVLDKMTDDQLKGLQTNAEKAKRHDTMVTNAKKVLNAPEGEGSAVDTAALAEFFGIATDPAQDPAGFIKELVVALDSVKKKLVGEATAPEATMEEMDAAAEPVLSAEQTTTNRRQRVPTTKEWLAGAPVEVQRAVRNSITIEANERTRLIRKLVANVKEERRPAMVQKLRSKTLDELQDMLDLLPPQKRKVENFNDLAIDPEDGGEGDDDSAPRRRINYIGAGGGGTVRNSRIEEDDVDAEEMAPRVINWKKDAEARRKETA